MAESSFGTYLRARRLAAKKSLREVADAVGVSHVYLGEVERGDSSPMREDRWPALVRAIPGVTLEDLRRHTQLTKPVQLSIGDAPPKYQELTLALARRIENRDLSDAQLTKILKVLGKKEGRLPAGREGNVMYPCGHAHTAGSCPETCLCHCSGCTIERVVAQRDAIYEWAKANLAMHLAKKKK